MDMCRRSPRLAAHRKLTFHGFHGREHHVEHLLLSGKHSSMASLSLSLSHRYLQLPSHPSTKLQRPIHTLFLTEFLAVVWGAQSSSQAESPLVLAQGTTKRSQAINFPLKNLSPASHSSLFVNGVFIIFDFQSRTFFKTHLPVQ